MRNSEIVSKLYDLGQAASRMKQVAKDVENIGRRMAEDVETGYAWKRPVDTNTFMQMIQMQKELEMREALALAAGATNDDLDDTYYHQEEGDLMDWLSEMYPGG